MGIGAKTIKTGTRVTDSHNQRPRRVGPLGLLGMTGGGTGRSLRMPGERLAKRKVRKESLVKCRVLPDNIRVRHGAGGAGVCGRPRPCSRRGVQGLGAGQFRAVSPGGPWPPGGRFFF